MSDHAETPEQFFGLDPVTKKPSYTESDEFRKNGYDPAMAWVDSLRKQPLIQDPDPEIERLLWEEEAIELDYAHGDEIRDLWCQGVDGPEIASRLGTRLDLVEHIVKDSNLIRVVLDETPLSHTSRFQRALYWYDSQRPSTQDSILLLLSVVTFAIVAFILYALVVV